MNDAIRSELLKLRTTRTFLGIVIATLALVALIAGAQAAADSFDSGSVPGHRPARRRRPRPAVRAGARAARRDHRVPPRHDHADAARDAGPDAPDDREAVGARHRRPGARHRRLRARGGPDVDHPAAARHLDRTVGRRRRRAGRRRSGLHRAAGRDRRRGRCGDPQPGRCGDRRARLVLHDRAAADGDPDGRRLDRATTGSAAPSARSAPASSRVAQTSASSRAACCCSATPRCSPWPVRS